MRHFYALCLLMASLLAVKADNPILLFSANTNQINDGQDDTYSLTSWGFQNSKWPSLIGSGGGGGSATNVNFYPGNNTSWRQVGSSNVVDVTGTLTNNTTGSASSANNATVATNLVNLQQVLYTNIVSSFNTNILIATGAGSATYNGVYNLMVGGLPPSFGNSGYSDPGTVAYTNLAQGKLVLLENNANDAGQNMFFAAPLSYDPQNDTDFYTSDAPFTAPYQWVSSSGTNVAPPPYFNYGTNYTTNVTLVYSAGIAGITLTNANTLFVSPSGNDQTAIVGNPAFPFSTIQYAVKIAPDFSTFVIEPGTFDISGQTINFHNAQVLAYGATINDFYPDPYGTGRITPIWCSGTFEMHGGTIYRTTAQQGTINYGDSLSTINDATNHFILDGVKIIAPSGGGVQGSFFNVGWLQPFDMIIKNCQFQCSWYPMELDEEFGATATNHTDYVLNNIIVASDGPLSSANHQCVFFASDHNAAYVTGNTIIINNTNSSTGGSGINCTAVTLTNTFVSGNTIDISNGKNNVTLAGASKMIVFGHPYDEITISGGIPQYSGLTNGAVNVMTNALNQFNGTFTGTGTNLTGIPLTSITTNGISGAAVGMVATVKADGTMTLSNAPAGGGQSNYTALAVGYLNATNGTFTGSGSGLTGIPISGLSSNGYAGSTAFVLTNNGTSMALVQSPAGGAGSSALPSSTNSVWNLTNSANQFTGTFTGNGGGLTNVFGTNIISTSLKTTIQNGSPNTLVVTNGNVGIGTTSPSAQLTVATNIIAGGTVTATNGFASYSSNTLALASITFPATTVNWTNSFGKNIFVFIDNAGVTGTALKINGTQIASSLLVTGDTMIPLQPGEYFSETYTIGTPAAVWKPQ